MRLHSSYRLFIIFLVLSSFSCEKKQEQTLEQNSKNHAFHQSWLGERQTRRVTQKRHARKLSTSPRETQIFLANQRQTADWLRKVIRRALETNPRDA